MYCEVFAFKPHANILIRIHTHAHADTQAHPYEISNFVLENVGMENVGVIRSHENDFKLR